jgi:hypothetical protein
MGMKSLAKAVVLGTAVVVLGLSLVGCAKEPGADYLETDVTSLMRGIPGEQYKLFDPTIPYLKGDFGIIRDNETMMVVEGDNLQDKLEPLVGSDFWLLGRKAGKPYVHFRAEGILVGKDITPVTNEGSHKLPIYRPADFDELNDYTDVDFSTIPFDSKRDIDAKLYQEKTKIQGVLVPFEIAGIQRYMVQNGDNKVILEPVTENLGVFLDLLKKEGGRFVAVGMLVTIKDWDDKTEMGRKTSKILGDYKVDYLLYGNVAVPNF